MTKPASLEAVKVTLSLRTCSRRGVGGDRRPADVHVLVRPTPTDCDVKSEKKQVANPLLLADKPRCAC